MERTVTLEDAEALSEKLAEYKRLLQDKQALERHRDEIERSIASLDSRLTIAIKELLRFGVSC